MSLTFLHFDTLGLEQLAKLLDLLLEFADEFRVSVLVDDGLAYNLFGTVGISVLSVDPRKRKTTPKWKIY